MAYITLDARRCSTRNAPMSRFGGARVGGVHKLWLRSRTDSSRYARKKAANLTLKHNIIFILARFLSLPLPRPLSRSLATTIIHVRSRKKSLALCYIAVCSFFYVRKNNLNKLITAGYNFDEIFIFTGRAECGFGRPAATACNVCYAAMVIKFMTPDKISFSIT